MAGTIQPDQPPPPYQPTDPRSVHVSQGNHQETRPAVTEAPFETKQRAFYRKLRSRDTISGDHSKYTVYRITHTPEEALRMAIFFFIDEIRFITRDLKTWRKLCKLATTLQKNAEEQNGEDHSPVYNAPSFGEFLVEQQKLMGQDFHEWRGIWQQGKEPIRRRELWKQTLIADMQAATTPRGERGRRSNTAVIHFPPGYQVPPGFQVQVTIVPSPGR